ncbi:gibberellin 20 oxidase 2-like [Momordica charantia]|uniref:Gibberellin 20 oxidase 2-like n=1 Tax=Momordica charantia TaxID=3673 RepID=A0A6J1CIE9_MOMCH|nr:gibberellin 20 oxidase 2-like [Momordica charantia]
MAMECMTTPSPSLEEYKADNGALGGSTEFKAESVTPENFIWPDEFKAQDSLPELHVPHIDIKKLLSGDEGGAEEAMRLVDEACRKHGFFVVVNHGVDMGIMKDLHKCMDEFFELPLDQKQKAHRKLGDSYGYTSSYIGRFSDKLPWKETFSVCYLSHKDHSSLVHDYVRDTLGQEFSHHGKVYQECCKAMAELSLEVVELLGMSLGLGREEFKKLYEDHDSIMRLNYYPTCENPELTLGTGPHCDPTSITILHQDHVSGLQVHVDDQWYSIPPTPDSFVVNIGDTFMALTNGVYKSCFHRAVVNCKEVRKSVAFFLCPGAEKLVRAPEQLVEKNPPRKFPDFTWPMLHELTQKFYRADSNTLKAFTTWLQQQKLGAASTNNDNN